MRQLCLLLALAPACATPTAVALQPAALAHEFATSVEAVPTGTQLEDELPPPSTHAPYALMFHDGQTWSFDVEKHGRLAMASSQQRSINCHTEVEFFCDRRVSNVVCDDENQIVGGTYTTTGRGVWRAAFNDATEQLDDKTRMLARYPESLIDGNGKPTARPFHGGWCATSSENGVTQTLCVSEDRGLTGGSLVSADGRIFIGDVPRS